MVLEKVKSPVIKDRMLCEPRGVYDKLPLGQGFSNSAHLIFWGQGRLSFALGYLAASLVATH